MKPEELLADAYSVQINIDDSLVANRLSDEWDVERLTSADDTNTCRYAVWEVVKEYYAPITTISDIRASDIRNHENIRNLTVKYPDAIQSSINEFCEHVMLKAFLLMGRKLILLSPRASTADPDAFELETATIRLFKER